MGRTRADFIKFTHFRHPRMLLSGIQGIASWHFVYKEVVV